MRLTGLVMVLAGLGIALRAAAVMFGTAIVAKYVPAVTGFGFWDSVLIAVLWVLATTKAQVNQ